MFFKIKISNHLKMLLLHFILIFMWVFFQAKEKWLPSQIQAKEFQFSENTGKGFYLQKKQGSLTILNHYIQLKKKIKIFQQRPIKRMPYNFKRKYHHIAPETLKATEKKYFCTISDNQFKLNSQKTYDFSIHQATNFQTAARKESSFNDCSGQNHMQTSIYSLPKEIYDLQFQEEKSWGVDWQNISLSIKQGMELKTNFE